MIFKKLFQQMIAFIAVGGLMVALAGCGGSQEKSEDDGMSGEDQIEAQPISFDPMGSDSGNIPGLYTVNFEYDKATLTQESKDKLRDNVAWLNDRPNVSLQIEGHCDNRGSAEYNLSLGERRANTVKSYLVSLGIDSDRLSIVSYGEEKPLAMGDMPSAWAQNRRANFVPLAQ